MAVTLLRTWDGAVRPWGYQLRIDLTDGVREFNELGHWSAEPTQDQIDARVAHIIARLEREALPPSQTYRVTCEDAAVVDAVDRPNTADALTAVSLVVSLTTEQRDAWTIVRPLLRAYLRKCFRLYQAATPDQRTALLAHNPILAAVIDMLGDA